jgi:hypothetical protein
LKLNGTHQFLVNADDVNIVGGSVHTVKEKAEALEVASRETGLEVNADKTKYRIMSWDQNIGRCHYVIINKLLIIRMFVPCINSIKALLLFHNDAHNHKITAQKWLPDDGSYVNRNMLERPSEFLIVLIFL